MSSNNDITAEPITEQAEPTDSPSPAPTSGHLTCDSCNGLGAAVENGCSGCPACPDCPDCNGLGYRIRSGDEVIDRIWCDQCAGTGTVHDPKDCPTCYGQGWWNGE